MQHKINTIIFDLGGVLVDWKPEYVYRNIFDGNEEKAQWFLKNVCTPEWNIEQDAGRTIEEGNKIKIEEFPEYEDLIKLFYEEWPNMFSGPIQESLDLFRKLKASENYKMYGLTNWSSEKWDKALELFPFFNDFNGVVVSGQEKTRKPFPKIYNILLERFNISPERAVFIDDNKDNVLAAKKLNIHGIHFKNPQQLIQEFKKLHVNL